MISACIGFKDRDVELLQAGIKALSASVDEIMISNSSHLSLITDDWMPFTPNLPPIAREVHLPGLPWREALSKNVAALHSVGNILLFTNCGIIIPRSVITSALSFLEPGKSFVCPAQMFIRASKKATRRYLDGDTSVDLAINPEWAHTEAGLGDFLLIYKDDFVRIGAYDSRYRGWGGLDRDFNLRALECGMTRLLADGTLYHLWDGYPATQSRTDGGGWKANQELMKKNKETGWWRNELRKT